MTRLLVRCGYSYPSGFHLHADFTIDPGITALVGASGSGKSTLVSLVAGLLTPETGEIRYGNRPWSIAASGTLLSPRRRGLGVAFQDGRLFPHLTVRANLLYGRRRFRTSRPAFDDVVEALEIGALLGRRPRSLSGGQQQRIALGRALLASEDVLLLDEPVSALDGPLRGRVLDYLAARRSDRKIILIASHDLEAIRRLRPEEILQAATGTIARHTAPGRLGMSTKSATLKSRVVSAAVDGGSRLL